jgi:hypothetical protein
VADGASSGPCTFVTSRCRPQTVQVAIIKFWHIQLQIYWIKKTGKNEICTISITISMLRKAIKNVAVCKIERELYIEGLLQAMSSGRRSTKDWNYFVYIIDEIYDLVTGWTCMAIGRLSSNSLVRDLVTRLINSASLIMRLIDFAGDFFFQMEFISIYIQQLYNYSGFNTRWIKPACMVRVLDLEPTGIFGRLSWNTSSKVLKFRPIWRACLCDSNVLSKLLQLARWYR